LRICLALLEGLEHPSDLGQLLDIGCYDGDKTNAIPRVIGSDGVVGVDFEGTPLHAAQRKGIQAVAADLDVDAPLPFADGSFDCIHAGEVIEHFFSPDLLLSEIARLLKPGGYAVITTPNLASWRKPGRLERSGYKVSLTPL
jgi:SAM-dependent methyltransferase